MALRITAFAALACMSLCIIGWLFWEAEIKYKFPTPVPSNFKEIPLGNHIDLGSMHLDSKPTLLHFFDAQCTCAKFNVVEVERIAEKYADEINIYIVNQSNTEIVSQDFESAPNLKIVADPKGILSDRCGVYSTPQGVLIDKNSHLFFKGNYSQASFCTKLGVRYIDLAIENILSGKLLPLDVQLGAAVPFGCNLPSDAKYLGNFNSPISNLLNQF